ncbi:MAG: homocysteine biosynthesis protein, partial [Dehalococcoidales bacterium]|nr:homocysteine biosynthesis protein [Dehalococcoidales bacterium]
GTQHSPAAPRTENGVPKRGAATLSFTGDLKQMNARWLRGVSMQGYGASLAVGIGIPIPILNEEILEYAAVTDNDILTAVVDYATAYPNNLPDILSEVSYAQLKSGSIRLGSKSIPTASLSSYSRALEISNTLKEWINTGTFLLSSPVAPIPKAESGQSARPLNYRPVERNNSY